MAQARGYAVLTPKADLVPFKFERRTYDQVMWKSPFPMQGSATPISIRGAKSGVKPSFLLDCCR